MPDIGRQDESSAGKGGTRLSPAIAGVRIVELKHVLTRSGALLELFRVDWPEMDLAVQQVNWQLMNPGAVTDWHAHRDQDDRIVAVLGTIKLALFDGREGSPTYGASDVIRCGALSPCLVVVPAGVWHGLRNESGAPAGYLNVHEALYRHDAPDGRRLGAGDVALPDIL